MKTYFENIPVIPFEGPKSQNPLAFRYYDPDRIVMGKPMSEHLPFAMAWWHNLGAAGTDMFGRDTGGTTWAPPAPTCSAATPPTSPSARRRAPWPTPRPRWTPASSS